MYRFLRSIIIGPLVRIFYRPTSRGLENIPRTGAVVFASNHISFIDPVFLAVVAPRPISFLAKSEYFTGKGIPGRLSRWFFRSIGQLPINRAGGAASEASLGGGREHLANGGWLGVYPEGTRSEDGLLHRGRTGVARVVLESGVPVIPVGITGTDGVMPLGSRFPKIHAVDVAFGPPLDFSALHGSAADGATLRSVTDQIMQAIGALSGQQYDDSYATRSR